MSLSRRVKQSRSLEKQDDPRRQTYAVLSGAVFFVFVNLFMGLVWIVSGTSVTQRLLVGLTLCLVDILSLVFTYRNLKRAVVWFRHVTWSTGLFVLYMAMISYDALSAIVGNGPFAALLLLFSMSAVFVLGYHAYARIWQETLPINISSGKIDALAGTYSLITAPAAYIFKNRALRSASALIVGGGSYLIGIGVFFGMRIKDAQSQQTYFYKAILFGLCALFGTLILSWLFYQYKWVRLWQQKNGKFMTTKYA